MDLDVDVVQFTKRSILQQCSRCAVRKRTWRLHHYDVVSNLCDEIEIVERDDNRTSGIGERTKPATGVEDMAGIEAGSWLIDDEHLRRADGGAGKHDPGKFTARQLRCGTIAQVEQIEAGKCRVNLWLPRFRQVAECG